MNTISWIILSIVAFLIVFDIAFLFGCWWATRNKETSNDIDWDLFLKPTSPKDPKTTYVCKRCGVRYEVESSQSDTLCNHCFAYLELNPDDEYFKREMFE